MLTHLQFHTLAVAAWAGPVLKACHIGIAGTPGHFTYQVCYFLPGWQPGAEQGFYGAAGHGCPFQAVAAAVAAAAAAGVPVCRRHAQRTIGRTVVALCGAQAIRPGFACRARRHRCARLHHA
ncbi:hypothetical protein [Hymenobacter koreensis]|uniref:hypothetical protein n=1 Tax=Hymenobacter koreensis TaxID=1084523 RepID=UPI0031E57C26